MPFDISVKGLPTLRDLGVNSKGKKVAKLKGDGEVTDVTVVVGDSYRDMHLNGQYLVEVRIRPAQMTTEDEPEADENQMTIEVEPKGLPEPTEVVIEAEDEGDDEEIEDVADDDVEDEEE